MNKINSTSRFLILISIFLFQVGCNQMRPHQHQTMRKNPEGENQELLESKEETIGSFEKIDGKEENQKSGTIKMFSKWKLSFTNKGTNEQQINNNITTGTSVIFQNKVNTIISDIGHRNNEKRKNIENFQKRTEETTLPKEKIIGLYDKAESLYKNNFDELMNSFLKVSELSLKVEMNRQEKLIQQEKEQTEQESELFSSSLKNLTQIVENLVENKTKVHNIQNKKEEQKQKLKLEREKNKVNSTIQLRQQKEREREQKNIREMKKKLNNFNIKEHQTVTKHVRNYNSYHITQHEKPTINKDGLPTDGTLKYTAKS